MKHTKTRDGGASTAPSRSKATAEIRNDGHGACLSVGLRWPLSGVGRVALRGHLRLKPIDPLGQLVHLDGARGPLHKPDEVAALSWESSRRAVRCTQGIQRMNELTPISAALELPYLISAASDHAQTRFLEFFAANIRNIHTRRAYAQATREFLAWCEHAGVASIDTVQPLHVAAYIEQLGRERSAPTVKQRLAAIRHLFDWLVTGQVVRVNPAASCAGRRTAFGAAKRPSLILPRRARCSIAST
jgi:hypothetical protein